MKTKLISLSLLLLVSCSSKSTLPTPGKDFPKEARAILESAERMEILALHPFPHEAEGKPEPGKDFRGYKVLGQKQLDSVQERLRAVALVYEATAKPGPFAACFNPRHAIRAVKGEEMVELVICFECNTLRIERTGAPRVTVPVSPKVARSMNAFFGKQGLTVHGKK